MEEAIGRRTENLRTFAREFNISVPVVYRLARLDQLPVPVIRIGNRMVVSRRAMDELLGQRKQTDHEEIAA